MLLTISIFPMLKKMMEANMSVMHMQMEKPFPELFGCLSQVLLHCCNLSCSIRCLLKWFCKNVNFLIQKHKQSPRIVILEAVCQFVVLLLSTFFGFSIFAAGFSFAFGKFAHYCVVLLNAPLSDRDKKKNKTKTKKKNPVCSGLLFLWSLSPSSLKLGGPVFPLVCSFRRRNNLAWRELLAELYELKSCIWLDRKSVV